MARISDEIRKWCDYCGGIIDSDDKAELHALADRIDRELVELPKSADGKIWTGREVDFWTGAADGDWHKFNSLAYIDDRWCVEDSDFERYPAVSVWYERPDSWERIANELEGLSVDSSDNYYVSTHCSKLAERIRRLAKEGER
jgi:hypothetical protein